MTFQEWLGIAGMLLTVMGAFYKFLERRFNKLDAAISTGDDKTIQNIDKHTGEVKTEIVRLDGRIDTIRDRLERYVPRDELDKRFERIEGKLDRIPQDLEVVVQRLVTVLQSKS